MVVQSAVVDSGGSMDVPGSRGSMVQVIAGVLPTFDGATDSSNPRLTPFLWYVLFERLDDLGIPEEPHNIHRQGALVHVFDACLFAVRDSVAGRDLLWFLRYCIGGARWIWLECVYIQTDVTFNDIISDTNARPC